MFMSVFITLTRHSPVLIARIRAPSEMHVVGVEDRTVSRVARPVVTTRATVSSCSWPGPTEGGATTAVVAPAAASCGAAVVVEATTVVVVTSVVDVLGLSTDVVVVA